MKHACLILGFVTGIILSPRPSEAQYTANFQTNIISGVTSNWTGSYLVGNASFGDVLLIQNGGVLSVTPWNIGCLGFSASSSNNSALVTGSGSVWNNGNSNDLVVGYSGVGNTLVISNGGKVLNGYSFMGWNSGVSNNHVVVTGGGSVWSNNFVMAVGFYGPGNSVVISNGGAVVVNDSCIVGSHSSNNSVIVTGSGSVWKNRGFNVGGGSNSLIINGGGAVVSGEGGIGGGDGVSSVIVTSSGSVWSNRSGLYVGRSSARNSLVISNGGAVFSGGDAFVGFESFNSYFNASNNSVVVTDANSVWNINSNLFVGHSCPGNSLVVSNGGAVAAMNVVVGLSPGSSGTLTVAGGASLISSNLTVGDFPCSATGVVVVAGGNLFVTNAAGDAVLEVRSGTFTLNSGTVTADKFVLTNACGQFVRTGGTLVYGSAVLATNRDDDGDGLSNGYEQSHGLDPLNADADMDADGDGMSNLEEYQAGTDPTNSMSAFRIIELWPEDDDMLLTWTAVGGKRYALQTTTGYGGSFSNNFIDLNPAIIATGTGETEVSVLHLGAATNAPSRFYRVRLVP